MAQKITEHCIIGSGLAALGAVMGLKDKGVQEMYLISDSRDDLEYYVPIQILRYLGLGGTSRFWHGVIPTQPNSPLRQHIFETFFNHSADMWRNQYLFVPKIPLRSDRLLKKMLPPAQLIESTAINVTLQGGLFKVSLQNGESVLARQVWCAAGVLGSLGILHRSGFCSDHLIIGDHICGFVGMLSLAQVETMVGRAVTADRGRDGYSVPCRFSLDGRTLFTLRPARYEMRNPQRQNRGGPKFSIGRSQIIWDLIKSRSFGRLSEAVALKMGIGFRAPMYAVHFQHECLSAHQYDSANEKLRPIYDKAVVAKEVSWAVEELRVDLGPVPEQDFYYGTHLFGAHGLTLLPQGLQVVDATKTTSIGGGHNSFTQLIQAYEDVQKSM